MVLQPGWEMMGTEAGRRYMDVQVREKIGSWSQVRTGMDLARDICRVPSCNELSEDEHLS